MPLYEHTLIARPDLSGQQAQTLAETFGQLITEQGGRVAKSEYWGLRNLAYRVKRNRKGHYLHIAVEAAPAVLTELERTERYHEDVLRFLTVKVESIDEGPSVVMQVRASRDDRGRRDRDRGDFRREVGRLRVVGGRSDDGPRRVDGPRREDGR
jgi:small subunit ribosomal protein S6